MAQKVQPFDPDELLTLIARLAAKRWLRDQQAKHLTGTNATPKNDSQCQTDPNVTR